MSRPGSAEVRVALNRDKILKAVDKYLPQGKVVGAIEQLLNQEIWRGGPTWEDRESILRRTRDDPLITDNNMATEWWAFGTYP